MADRDRASGGLYCGGVGMLLIQSSLSLTYCCASGIRQPLHIKDGGWIVHAYGASGRRFGIARYAESDESIMRKDFERLEKWLEDGHHGLFRFSRTEFTGSGVES